MAACGVSVFLAAFLFFHLQPLMGRHLLPAFGGGPAVWSVCLVFWQGLLLAGYLWAHWLRKLAPARWQWGLQLLLCLMAVFALPIRPEFKVGVEDTPVPAILWLLMKSVGLPGLALAASAPLVQCWFAGSFPDRSPYRLYALSNAAALLALLVSTLVSDVFLTRAQQSKVWSLLFVAYVLGIVVARPRDAAAVAEGAPPESAPVSGPGWLWWLLPGCGAALLSATTDRLTTDLAVVPFLWTAPLAVYLLTWILAFDHPRWYRRSLYARLLPVALFLVWVAAFAARLPGGPGLAVLLPIQLGGLFVGCLVCHGELHRLRPPPGQLSLFYLALAGGGLLGAVSVGLVAPLLFPLPVELPLALLLCGGLAVAIHLRERPPGRDRPESFGRAVYLVGGLLVYALAWTATTWGTRTGTVRTERNFFGVASVREQTLGAATNRARLLVHGATIHGLQYQTPERSKRLTTYFGPDSGFAVIWRQIRGASPVRVGVIGLGAGTLAAYGRDGDRFRFYEINPAIEALAREEFSFLRDSAAGVSVVIGDARISMAREAANGFDLLVIDAFNGGAIPIHLLTAEAFTLYRRHLSAGGAIAIHATNKHLDLGPPIRGGAAAIGMGVRQLSSRLSWETIRDTGQRSSDWYFLHPDPGGERDGPATVWTDELASLLPLLK